MNKYLFTILYLALLCINTPNLISDVNSIVDNKNITYNRPNNSYGYEFYVAIAPNDELNNRTGSILLYIISQDRTVVDYYLGIAKIGSFTLEPHAVKLITLDPSQCEIRTSETPLKQTYRFVSHDKPISICEISAKNNTNDGTIILPVNSYGKEYMHSSYWENGISKYNYNKSGFIIIASEDNTECYINLKSANGNIFGKTDKGRVAGETWRVILQKGECYKVCTDAGTRGEFDISGTKVTSNNPIGMISFHERAEIPRLAVQNSSNHLVEMIPPINAWGKKYYSLEFNRTGGGGDLFRIACKESNTKYNVEWYSLTTGALIASDAGLLAQAGDFVEIVDMPNGRPNYSFNSIKGSSKFSADKPVLVCQYSFSIAWDGTSNTDPYYVALTPAESYVNRTCFYVKKEDNNYINLLVKGDTSNAQNNYKLLSNLKLISKNGISFDTVSIIKMYPKIETNNIPGSDIYWAKLNSLSEGVYALEADTKFAAYSYCSLGEVVYAYNIANANSNLFEIDTIPPKIERTNGKCGSFNIKVTELNNEAYNTNPNAIRQVDQGIEERPSLLPSSFNAIMEFPGGEFYNNGRLYDYTFTIKPVDMKLDMFAILKVVDRCGNASYDTISFVNTNVAFQEKNPFHFGNKIRFGTKPIKTAYLINNTTSTINIYGIFLQKNRNNNNSKPYTLISGFKNFDEIAPITLAVNDSLRVQVQFNSLNDNILEIDTLKIITDCNVSNDYLVIGKAALPKIKIEDCNFEKIQVQEEATSKNKITIQNTGTDTLTVYGFDLPNTTAFKYNPKYFGFIFPIDIAPANKIVLNDFIIFAPKSAGKHTAQLTFSHNGDHNSDDSVCVLTGEGEPISSVNEENDDYVKITPNPISGETINVELPEYFNNNEIKAEIIDESGKSILNYNSLIVNNKKLNLKVNGINPGFYFLKLNINDKEIIKKIIVSK